ncbi:multidrug ABC transporter ATP-binding protein [Longispora fulva]|uniref:ABC-2 type transport system ATP-binding protein n=1 Tax=Longispora fulva TaxID=619741 RepID=A0A8J7GP61_9ACTN|nr:ABC transporter ATP-binding protein [Longispora fulva]MBG6135313.1 ABC-2 type transport system ATP-binding protein [Longispora fulva]GIG56448.1 multidrug ABC transporter ATP-binding protein [Longispora fulva]
MADAVTLRDITVRYGPKVAVDAVSLTVGAGEVVGVIGPNGAGKTSLLECAEGLRRPAGGTVTVAGLDPLADRARLALVTGVQPQHSSYPDRARVEELCRLYAGFYPAPADWGALLDEFGLGGSRRSWATKLSGGQKQRLSLVLALIGRPEVVFLDELTTGLDPTARRDVWAGLRRRNTDGLTIVITSHHMEEVEFLCDRVAVLVGGRLVALDSVVGLVRAHAGDTDRLVVEDAGPGLRRELEAVDPGVLVSPAGQKLLVDASGAARELVTRLLAERGARVREVPASLDDVYLRLTGQPSGGNDVR